MKTGRFLQSKLGRRIFVLFITCAMLPIVVLTVVSSTFVARQLHEQARERLQQMTKSAGMEFYRAVEAAGDELELAAAFIDGSEESVWLMTVDLPVANLLRSFRSVELVTSDGRRTPILEPLALPTPALQELRVQTLEHGVRLSSHAGVDGSHRVYLGAAVGGETPGPHLLAGEIRPEILRDLQQVLPADMELLVLDPGQHVVAASPGTQRALSHEILAGLAHPVAGEFDWNVDDEPHMARHWSVFFGPRYGSPNWTVVLSQPRVDSVAALRQFGKLLPLFVLFCLMVVVLMSMAQIRKSMIPLRKLQEGTERIASRRFDSKVEVDSGDEFEILAVSFNSMASDLDRQFRTLTTLAEIDRSILSTVDEDRIVHTILERIMSHYAGDGVAVALTDAGTPQRMTVHVRWRSGAICDTTDHVTLDAEDRWRLTTTPKGYITCGASEIPAYLRELTTQGIEHVIVIPLSVRQGLAGCIALGSRARPAYREEELQDLRRLANQVAVALSNARLVDELERTNWETLYALARAVDANSPWTAGHSERVTAMAVRLGQRLGLDEEELAMIHRGGLLHDIGKIGISSEILDKPARLTDAEMAVMRSHPTLGARILEPITAYAREIPIVLYHHERFDGLGYPEGLAGEAIPRNARILAVADVFDALISERPYRGPWDLPRVIEFILEGSGTHFDPQIVPVFLAMIEQETALSPGNGNRESIRDLSGTRTVVHT